MDVSDERQVEEAANQVRNKIGDIDILVNNAVSSDCFLFIKTMQIYLQMNLLGNRSL